MNDGDVSKQIQQMVQFICQEAEEKVNEISVSAKEEFNIEKLQLVEAEKKKVRQEFDRKAKYEYSMQLNASRLKVLQAQDEFVNDMKEVAGKELILLSSDTKTYQKLLQGLIVQIILSNCGDSRAILCRGTMTIPLTVDQKNYEGVIKKGDFIHRINTGKKLNVTHSMWFWIRCTLSWHPCSSIAAWQGY